ncbi:MAG TPA: STT3 domain-containing protein [archaeon]|nr:STT3 domain-containing protein [archaeon]
MQSFLKPIFKRIEIPLLLGIIGLAIFLRLTTANVSELLDYDPWWFFRHAQEILSNGFLPPKWDILSYFPPGRAVDYQLGWPYTIAIFYKLTQSVMPALTLTQFSIYWIAIFSAVCAVPAYLVGRMVTNKWGGLVTAFISTISITFLAVSMAGYPDSDAVDVFYTFLTILTTLYAIKQDPKTKKGIAAILIAVVSYWLFAFNWNSSWYIYYIFLGFIPIYLFFQIVESLISRQPVAVGKKIKDAMPIIVAIILTGVIGTAASFLTEGWPFNTINPIQQLLNGFNFLSGQALIVNISVAELQPINVFSREGLLQVFSRVGFAPAILALLIFPFLFIKFWYKKKITLMEYFVIIWMIFSLWLITRGVRFSLLFSLAVATSAGLIIGELVEFLKQKKNLFLVATVYGLIIFGMIWYVSDSLQFSQTTSGLDIGDNWRQALNWIKDSTDKKALIATWWDPGHIITGFTGRRVHADGAHCTPESCIPYNHNVRIQDMGRIFATSNEDESLQILKKYEQLTPQDCQLVKTTFGSVVPDEACDKVPEMYLIASADLIGKYYWLSFFGTGTGRSYVQLPLSNYGVDQQGNIAAYYYGGGAIVVAIRNESYVPILNNKVIANEIIYYKDNKPVTQTFNTSDTVQGTVWVEPSFGSAIFMEPDVKNSVFTKLFFFDGEGLKNFQLVFNNGEVKIFKVNL